MTNKAYIVVNEQQEGEVLEKLEREGMTWSIINEKPTENKPSNRFKISIFPYIIFVEKNTVTWNFISRLEDKEIVFDGRKEEKMSDKYVVSQEFMNELNIWYEDLPSFSTNEKFVGYVQIQDLSDTINEWWQGCGGTSNKERNNHLIAIIRWVNGEDVFEVEKPKKWVVRSIGLTDDDERYYVSIGKFMGLKRALGTYSISQATRFDTKEEAESWANSHQEVIEVEE